MAALLDRATSAAVTNRLRKNGDRVVFTHGAFDLFHIGHATLLKKSKLKGDFLVVGVESDERIATYKDSARPVIPLEQRVKILLANKDVDFVLSLNNNLQIDDDYYLQLYELFNPSVVTRGRHYLFRKNFELRKKLVPNVKFSCISHEYDDVQSTTKIIEKIRTD